MSTNLTSFSVIYLLLTLGGCGVVFAVCIVVLAEYTDRPLHELTNTQIAWVLLCMVGASLSLVLFASIVVYAIMQLPVIN